MVLVENPVVPATQHQFTYENAGDEGGAARAPPPAAAQREAPVVGWVLAGVTNKMSWMAAAHKLVRTQDNTHFEWGYWWLYGVKNKYITLKALVASDEWRDMKAPSYQSMSNALTVCRAFPPERVRSEVPFSFYPHLTRLAIDRQEYWLDWIERRGASIDQLQKALARSEIDQAQPIATRKGRAPMPPLLKLQSKIKKMHAELLEVVSSLEGQRNLPSEQRRAAASLMLHTAAEQTAAANDLWCADDEKRYLRKIQDTQKIEPA